ncbi:MAG TPA: CoA transferase, partial [Novosphingobium sp.]
SLALDTGSQEGQAELARLLGAADIFIHDGDADLAGGLLEPAQLAERFPHLIVGRIGSWPMGHPRAATPMDEDLVLAEAGVFDEQPPIGRDGPGFVRFRLGDGGSAYLCAIGILGRLLSRDRLGGGRVDTSLIQGAMSSLLMLWNKAEQSTPSLDGGHIRKVMATIYQCSDGLWMHVMSNPDKVPSMAAGISQMDPEERERLLREFPSPSFNIPSDAVNAVVFRTRTRAEWIAELRENDIAVAPCLALGELYDDEQARINGYAIEVNDPVLGPTTQPGPPIGVQPPAAVRHAAPPLDSGRDVVAGWTPRAAAGRTSSSGGAGALPLAGIKVLDLGNYLAGPLAPMIMADMGADVIKLEVPAGDPLRNVEWAFNGCQRNKRGIAADLKQPEGQAVLKRLIEWADVVHHNLRMPAARKLGLDYEAVSAINPQAIFCHVSSYGPTGPSKDWPGYDQMMQSSCGWEYEGAGEGNRPTWFRFGMMDHQCAMASAIATLIALLQRKADGKGRAVNASLLGAGMMTMRETVRLADGSLTPYARLDHAQMGTSPQRRLFHCADGWIMTVTEADGAHARLLGAMGAADVGALEQAMAARDCATAIAAVRGAGGQAVRATENQREAFLADPDNIAAGLVATFAHPVYRRLDQPGALFSFGNAQVQFRHAPPVIGQSSREILGECGFAPAEIEEMIGRGVVAAA